MTDHLRVLVRLSVPLAVTLAAAAPSPAGDFFVTAGGSGSTCVRSAPCPLATALAAAGDGDRVVLGAGTYTGTSANVAVLEHAVSLVGGWDKAPSGDVKLDPVAFPSVLDGQHARRVVKLVAAGAALDGLTIRNGNATGLAADCPGSQYWEGCGGGILVLGTDVTIANSVVADNVGDTSPSNGLYIGVGGGIMAYFSDRLTLRDCTISGNVAAAASPGLGGGLLLYSAYGSHVTGNRFVGNSATAGATWTGWGGGLALSGDATIDRNYFTANHAGVSGTYLLGNAIYSDYGFGTITGNRVRSDAPGSAVYLEYHTGTLTGNTVYGGADEQIVRVVDGGPQTTTLIDNVLVAGPGAEQVVLAEGYVKAPVTLTMLHNTVVGNRACTGILAGDTTTATVTNTIITQCQTGTATEASGSLVADHDLFWENFDDGLPGSAAVAGNPSFVNRAFGDFHVQYGSAAIDAGMGAGVTTDLDGDLRTGDAAPDIGADELAPRDFDFGTEASPVILEAVRVTPATVYTPVRGYGWLDGTIAARDRGQLGEGEDEDVSLRDFNFTHEGTFVVDIPPGRYWVGLWMGDITTAHSQMAVYVEGVLRGNLSTAAGSFASPTYPVSVTDGQLTIHFKDLGGSDPNVVVNEITITQAPEFRIDLGTGSSPVFGGFDRATTAAYSEQKGYGWSGGTLGARDRGTPDSLLRDFVFTPRGLFDTFFTNGRWDVKVTMGDAAAAHELMGLALQGAEQAPVSAAKNTFPARTMRVDVADNHVGMRFHDLGGSDPNVVVNAIEFTRMLHPLFDFGTATSPISFGYIPVSDNTPYADGRGWGWTAGSVGSRDRGTPTPINRDFVFTHDATFSVDVVPGRYLVTLVCGDATTKHDQMGIFLEGEQVATLTTNAGQFSRTTYPVIVLDGRLDVRLTDQGGSDPNVVLNGIEIY